MVRCGIENPPESFSISSIGIKIEKDYFDEKGALITEVILLDIMNTK